VGKAKRTLAFALNRRQIVKAGIGKEKGNTVEWMLLPIRRYADFSGRSRPKEYWMFTLFQLLIGLSLALVIGILGSLTGSFSDGGGPGILVSVLLGLFGLAYLALFLVPGIAVTVRRWHDQNKSGWFILLFTILSAIPVIGFLAAIANIVFMCLAGTSGPNRYGEDPMAKENLSDVFR
jgi:uncharacterized membrane protein YhaH (DUF805 family)